MTSKILRLKELISYIGLSRSAIYERMDEKSERYDPSFPKSFALGGKATGWYVEKIDAWLAHCADPVTSYQIPPRKKTAIRNISETEKPRPVLTTPQFSEPQNSPKTLAEMIVEGGQMNDIIEKYMSMPTWTPAMGALLVNGVAPDDRCMSIPTNALGFDNTRLSERHPRLIAAQKLLDLFLADEEDGQSAPTEVTPLDFYIWCDESSVDTVWLRHINAVARITKSEEDLSSATFALLTRR